ncbi:MAG: NUDIX domain-containing protein [Bacteroidota bacterium]
MYKVYINNTPFQLLSTEEHEQLTLKSDDRNLVGPYAGKSKFLLHYIDMLEKTDRYDSIILYAPDVTQLKADFQSLYKVLPAAGGLVFNEEGEALLIYRLNMWDLPKGKIEKGESIKAAAIREVEEETGLRDIRLGDFICETYHTYKNKKGKRCLKLTYWYKMETRKQELIPQTEENIEKAIWVKLNTFFQTDRAIYPNVLSVIHAGSDF